MQITLKLVDAKNEQTFSKLPNEPGLYVTTDGRFYGLVLNRFSKLMNFAGNSKLINSEADSGWIPVTDNCEFTWKRLPPGTSFTISN